MGVTLMLTLSLLVAAKEANPAGVLEQLLRPAEALPTDCRVAWPPRTAPILPARTNPYVSADDRAFISFIATLLRVEAKHVRAAASTVYRESEEVGVYALVPVRVGCAP